MRHSNRPSTPPRTLGVLVPALIILALAAGTAPARTVTVTTTEPVIQVPQGLVFTETGSGTVHQIPLSGSVPGTTFTGQFPDVAVGVCGIFSLAPGTLVDAAGNAGNDITAGSDYCVEPPPPTPTPTQPPYENEIALYNLNEGAGAAAADASLYGALLPLQAVTSGVSWASPGPGLVFSGATVRSVDYGAKICNAARGTNRFSLEIWVEPANLTQTGPARMVSMSSGTAIESRNFTLGQNTTSLDIRLRTGSTVRDDVFPVNLGPGVHHIVVTHDGTTERVYVDGVQKGSVTFASDFSTWDPNLYLLLGNEYTNDRPWLGTIYRTAIFCRALDAGEVASRYAAGYGPIEPPPTPTAVPSDTPAPTDTPRPSATPTPTLPAGQYVAVFGDAAGADFPGTCEDTYLNMGAFADTNFSADTTGLNTYTWPKDTIANTIAMKWDLSSLPRNANVSGARLDLLMSTAGGDALYTVSAHTITGKNPIIGLATWNTYDGVNAWTNGVGGGLADIGPAADARDLPNTVGTYYSWDITEMVRGWAADPASNRGLLLLSDPSANQDSYRSFIPTENPDPSRRPRLVVAYTIGVIEPTATPTVPPPTATATLPPPTNTPRPSDTPVPTDPPQPTATLPPPTSTPRPTDTPVPTDTPEPTATLPPPTSTPVPTDTPPPTEPPAPTDTPEPTATVPPPTDTPPPSPTPTEPAGQIVAVFGDVPGTDYPGTCEDTYFNTASFSNTNYSSDTDQLNTYTWPKDTIANTIAMKWNISSLPPNANVSSARLELFMYAAGGDALYTVSVHQVTGKDPVIQLATWNSYDGVNAWTDGVGGGLADIGPAADSRDLPATIDTYYSWDVTGMVRDWAADPALNRGLLVLSDPNASRDSHRYFIPTDNPDPSRRPRLVVTYSIGVIGPTATPTATVPPPTATPTPPGVQYSLNLRTSTDAPWALFSLPIASESTIDTIMASSGAGTGWKLYRYDTTSKALAQYGSDPEFGNVFEVGRGYLYMSDTPASMVVWGMGSPAGTFPIPLTQGWNLIGYPYDLPLSWHGCRVEYGGESLSVAEAGNRGWVQPSIWRFAEGDYFYATADGTTVDVLEPGLGYWFYAYTSCTLVIPSPVTKSSGIALSGPVNGEAGR